MRALIVAVSVLICGCAHQQSSMPPPSQYIDGICPVPTIDQPCKDRLDKLGDKATTGMRYVWDWSKGTYTFLSSKEMEDFINARLEAIKQREDEVLKEIRDHKVAP